jgi:hypothetical protein
MFGLFKRKKVLPALSPEMHQASQVTIDWCLSQVSSFLGVKVETCPKFSDLDDERIAAYACGFLTGYLQETRAESKWARGDEGLIQLGLIALMAAVLVRILGSERALRVQPLMPFFDRSKQDLNLLYKAGGGDGIAHAEGREKQFGGRLLHYLKNNVEQQQGTLTQET